MLKYEYSIPSLGESGFSISTKKYFIKGRKSQILRVIIFWLSMIPLWQERNSDTKSSNKLQNFYYFLRLFEGQITGPQAICLDEWKFLLSTNSKPE